MKRRDFLRSAALCLLAGQVGQRIDAADASDNRLTVAASKGRQFLAGLFDPAVGLLPEYAHASRIACSSLLVASHTSRKVTAVPILPVGIVEW
jgi:hypothetical protein